MNLGWMSATLSRHDGVDPSDVEFAVVDVETTGLDAATDRVVEVAAVRMRNGEVVDEFATLVNPQRRIVNTVYHGIADEQVAEAPTWPQVAPIVASYLSGAVMVCHNSKFDRGFLTHEFRRAGLDIAAVPTLCTLLTARAQLDLWGYKLRSTVGRITGIWPDYEHTALDDARTTARLLRGFLKDAPEPVRLKTTTPALLPGLPATSVAARHRVQVEYGSLVHIVEQLPITTANRPADQYSLSRYLATLNAAVSDHRISVEEAEELATLICCGGLTRDAVEAVHRELLKQHRLAAHADGVITWQEGEALRKIGALVGMPEHIAAEERLGRLDKAKRRALADWRVVGIGLDDDVAEILDLAADHSAAVGTSITARTRLVVVNDRDRSLPRVKRAVENGKLVLSPQDAREHLISAVQSATPPPDSAMPSERRVPIVRWQEHWRPFELNVEDCIGRFDEDARVHACERARRRTARPTPTMTQTAAPPGRVRNEATRSFSAPRQVSEGGTAATPTRPAPAPAPDPAIAPTPAPAPALPRPRLREEAPVTGTRLPAAVAPSAPAAKDDQPTSNAPRPTAWWRVVLKVLYLMVAAVLLLALIGGGVHWFLTLVTAGLAVVGYRLLRAG